MSIGFRMTVFSAPAQSRTTPRYQLDCFPLQDQTDAETVAFGYRARLFLNSESEDFWLSARCAVSKRRATVSQHQFRGEGFRSRFD
jgi:hypothetical protein